MSTQLLTKSVEGLIGVAFVARVHRQAIQRKCTPPLAPALEAFLHGICRALDWRRSRSTRQQSMGSHALSVKPPENELRLTLDSLRQIVRVLRLSATKAEKTRGVSGAQLFVLQILAERPAASIADLASRTVTDASSVSVVVKRLGERGLVVRRPSKTDARRAELALTKKGSALICTAPQVAQTKLIDAFAMLSPAIQRSLSHGLAELVSKMGDAADPPQLFFEEGDDDASASRPTKSKSGSRRRAIS